MSYHIFNYKDNKKEILLLEDECKSIQVDTIAFDKLIIDMVSKVRDKDISLLKSHYTRDIFFSSMRKLLYSFNEFENNYDELCNVDIYDIR